MKKTNYFILAAAAALFAACSSDDGLAPEQQPTAQTTGQVPVAFDTYVNRTTRAGLTGLLDLDAIKANNVGFGVFAYYTNADNYDASSFTPNFMYNQQVKLTGTGENVTWTYSPVKYWPNEFGGNALSEDVDKVSFFAYAPYVTVTPASGKVKDNSTVTGDAATYSADDGEITMGIVGMTKNSAVGDPMVKYISTFYTDEQVDLVWGTVATGQTWATKQSNSSTGSAMTSSVGLPWLNVEHPYATSTAGANKVKFQFLHALASLNVQVDTKVNGTSVGDPANGTKVYIRSVTFEGFDTKGALNLNNVESTKANWYNFNCSDELNNGAEVTIKDGRKDGKEGVTAATSEYAAINPYFVQSTVWNDNKAPRGVTINPKNLFCFKTKVADNASTTDVDESIPALEDPIYVIPNDDPLKVTIEYDVLTEDPNVVGKLNDGQTSGSVVKNVITRYITKNTSNPAGSVAEPTGTGDNYTGIKLANGKKYTIYLHLGLNSVEFDADVTDWNSTSVTGGADLPHNN